MSLIGDVDPEDAWDEGDPRPDKLAILVRMLVSIAFEERREDHDRDRILARLDFGHAAAAKLSRDATDAERPILEAITLGLFYLHISEES